MQPDTPSIALEAIDYQDGKFFKELTEACQALRGWGAQLSDEEYWRSPEVQTLGKVIGAWTLIQVQVADDRNMGPMTRFPNMDANHPFMQEWVKNYMSEGYTFDAERDARALMKTMETDILHGTVNLKNGQIGGVFTKLSFKILMPREFLDSDRVVKAEGCAAILLHELGHIFTYFEYIGRTFTTNQVLAGMIRAMDEKVEAPVRTVVMARGIKLLQMTKEEQEAILNAKREEEVTVIVLDSMIRRSRSELACNIFDSTAAEQVADQYLARQGAGRAYIIADDAVEKMMYPKQHAFQRACIAFAQGLAGVFLVVFTNFFFVWKFLAAYVLFPEYEVPEHNSLKGRYNRILNEVTGQLKNRDLDPDLRKQLISDYDAIKEIADRTKDDALPLLRKLSYIANPRYRNARKFHLLQNDLEALAATGLFAHAAKFSSL